MVRRAARLSAGRPPPFGTFRSEEWPTPAEAARPATPAAPPRRAAVGADDIEWVEIPGGQGGVRALQHVVSGEICLGPPADWGAGWAVGWVELLEESEVEHQQQGGYRYYWHMARKITQWERPQPGHDTRAPASRPAGMCIICWDRDITTALLPCGHWCACGDCAAVLRARGDPCPACRVGIEDVVRIYYIGDRDYTDASGSGGAESSGIVRDHTFSNGGNMTAQGTHGPCTFV